MPEMVYLPPGFKEDLQKKYSELKSSYEELVDEVLYIVRKALSNNQIKVHSVTSRDGKIKTFESFFGKVVRKGIMFDQFEVVEDIAAIRIICLYRTDLQKIEDLLSQIFDILKTDTVRTRKEAPFGYASNHYTVKLSKNCSGPRYDNAVIKNLKCEIQVRTILMDAWATVSHHLDYKQEIDIPTELRADFNGLSGLFFVADTHFELFKKGVNEARAQLKQTVDIGELSLDLEINLDTLTTYLQWKFPDRKINKIEDSRILQELLRLKYYRLIDLESKVNKVIPYLKEIECKRFDLKIWEPHWTPDGLIRNILDLTDDKYYKRWNSYRNGTRKNKRFQESINELLKLYDDYRSKMK